MSKPRFKRNSGSYFFGINIRQLFSLLCFILIVPTVYAQTQLKPTTGKSAAEKMGMHVIFDASGSMCGYLKANDPAKALLTIIKRATALKDSEKNNKVMLVRQASASPNAARDIFEAPGNFQALAENVASDSKAKCAPFDGVDSNVELIFSPKSPSATARSLLLVSDIQLEEKAQISFVDQFRIWARAQGVQPAGAGMITLKTPFFGSYYPVTDVDPVRRQSGYALQVHDRPLTVMWFVAGTEDAAIVRGLLTELGLLEKAAAGNFAYGLQVLPMQSEKRDVWLKSTEPLTSISSLFGTPKIDVKAAYTGRRPEILRGCVDAGLKDDELVVKTRKKCGDEKPFFESVSGLDVLLPFKSERGIKVSAQEKMVSTKGATLIISYTRNTPSVTNIGLTLTSLPGELDSAKIAGLTLDNDSCSTAGIQSNSKDVAASVQSWQKQCVGKLAGKVYRYDAFVQQFSNRAKVVIDEQLSAVKLNLKAVFER